MRASWASGRLARLALAVTLAGVLGLGYPVGAGATTTGGGVFTATITLPIFPCTGCGGGAASGTAALSLSGVGTLAISGVPLPYTAEWTPTASSLTALFNYQDTCELGQPDGTVPISGNGDGTFTLSGGAAVIGAGIVSGATLSGSVHIDRIANSVRLTLASLTITPPSGSPVLALTTDLIPGQSAAGLVWTNGPGTCPINAAHQVSNQTAQVVGVVVEAT